MAPPTAHDTDGAFHSVGLWYEDFSATTDDEVRALLEEARGWGRRAQAC